METKHVESCLVSCLDPSSILGDSTIKIIRIQYEEFNNNTT